MLMCRVCSPEIIQTGHQDWTRTGRGREGSEDATTVLHVQNFHRGGLFVCSLDVQDITLFQAKAGLVLVKKAL